MIIVFRKTRLSGLCLLCLSGKPFICIVYREDSLSGYTFIGYPILFCLYPILSHVNPILSCVYPIVLFII